MATLLEAYVIANALARMPLWSGDTEQLSRTARLTDDQHADVQQQVMERADAMDHHPSIERAGEQTQFTLSTHSAGGVTALDLVLATEIDDVLHVVLTPGT